MGLGIERVQQKSLAETFVQQDSFNYQAHSSIPRLLSWVRYATDASFWFLSEDGEKICIFEGWLNIRLMARRRKDIVRSDDLLAMSSHQLGNIRMLSQKATTELGGDLQDEHEDSRESSGSQISISSTSGFADGRGQGGSPSRRGRKRQRGF